MTSVHCWTLMPETCFPWSSCTPCFSQKQQHASTAASHCAKAYAISCSQAIACKHSSFTKPCSFCRDNHASAGSRGVVFVGGPNSTTYARRGGTAGGRGAGAPGSGPGSSAYNLLRLQSEGAAALGTSDRAVEGPPQVTRPGHVCVPCLRVCLGVCS